VAQSSTKTLNGMMFGVESMYQQIKFTLVKVAPKIYLKKLNPKLYWGFLNVWTHITTK
jgi:hypothetical protein